MPLLTLPVITRSKPTEFERSRVLDALAEAYLANRQTVQFDGIDDETLLAVIRQLSDRNPCNKGLRERLSLTVLFYSEYQIALRDKPNARFGTEFTPHRRRFKEPAMELPPKLTFTGRLSPLFNS